MAAKHQQSGCRRSCGDTFENGFTSDSKIVLRRILVADGQIRSIIVSFFGPSFLLLSLVGSFSSS